MASSTSTPKRRRSTLRERLDAYLRDVDLDALPLDTLYRGACLGSGLSRKRWFCACSLHYLSYCQGDCPRCMKGMYVTLWKHQLLGRLVNFNIRVFGLKIRTRMYLYRWPKLYRWFRRYLETHR